MNKRLLVLILVFALVVGTAMADPAGMDFSLRGGVKGKACVVSYLIPIRSGPGYLYDNIDEELASFSEGTELTVLSQVSVNGETWVQAEVPSSWGKIRAYLVAVSGGDTLISYSSGSVPWEIRPDELPANGPALVMIHWLFASALENSIPTPVRFFPPMITRL